MLDAVALICALLSADDPRKSEKTLTPKQQREAAEKAIKTKMAPIEEELSANKDDLAAAKSAKVNGRNTARRVPGTNRFQYTEYGKEEQKKADIEKYAKKIDELSAKLKPFEDELAALKKKPLPTPEKPKEPTKP